MINYKSKALPDVIKKCGPVLKYIYVYIFFLHCKNCFKWTNVFIIHFVQFMYLDRKVPEENQSRFQALKSARKTW